jgi:hypothetical protein
MSAFDPRIVLAVLGPLFLLLGVWRLLKAGALVPQARAWLLIGAIFSAVAIWLWTR